MDKQYILAIIKKMMTGLPFKWEVKFQDDKKKTAQIYVEKHNRYVVFLIYPLLFNETRKRQKEIIAHECGHIPITDIQIELEVKYRRMIEETATDIGLLFLGKARGVK